MLRPVGAVELRNTLQSRLDAELPATLTFDYPTISALAGYLAANHAASMGVDGGTGRSAAAAAAAPQAGAARIEELLAELQGIVAGMLGAEVAPDQPLMEAGLVSLGVRQLWLPDCSMTALSAAKAGSIWHG